MLVKGATGRRQAIIWTNAGILLIEPLGTISMPLSSKFIHFHSRKCIWKCRQEYGGHNVSTSMCRRFCSGFSEFTAAFTADLMPVGCESLVASVPLYIFQNSALPACPEYYFLLVCTEPSGICSTIKKKSMVRYRPEITNPMITKTSTACRHPDLSGT